MVREDQRGPPRPDAPASPGSQTLDQTLESILVTAPQGLEPRRVMRWARQLAAALDARPRPRGRIGLGDILIDERDDAHLRAAEDVKPAAGPGAEERALLLGRPDDRGGDGVRDLAAALYVALGGDPAEAAGAGEPAPIPGVSVQVNLALLSALGPAAELRPATAAELADRLEGAPVPLPRRRRASPGTRRVLAAAVAAAAVLAAAGLGAWSWWVDARPRGERPAAGARVQAPTARDAPRRDVRDELRSVERDLAAAGATRAREAWRAAEAELSSVALPEEPGRARALAASAEEALRDGRYAEARDSFEAATAALLESRGEAAAAAKEAAKRWRQARGSAPPAWAEVPAVQAACSDALGLAEDAAAAAGAGRYGAAVVLYDEAAAHLEAAVAGHRRVTAARLAEVRLAREAGDAQRALGLLDALVPRLDPAVAVAERVETYLAIARARTALAQPGGALDAVQRVLELEPQHPEALSLQAVLAVKRPRAGELLVNSLSQTLVYVEPGAFMMGSPPGELFGQLAERQHRVRLTRGFWIGRIEVTRGQFAKFAAATGYVTDAEVAGWALGLDADGSWRRLDGASWRDPGFPQTDGHPVVCVSLDDALAFCDWLGRREDRDYRLPTEAEWEYACRAGSEAPYAWGSDPFERRPRANTADVAWMSRFPDTVGFRWYDGWVYTSPVAGFPPNAWGLFDVHGNVQEWCADVYGAYPEGEVADPCRRPEPGDDKAPRVLRGGSFASPPARCRAAHRDASRPDECFVTVGFRVVMEAASEHEP